MATGYALLIAVIIALLVLVVAGWVWYHYIGTDDFKFKGGEKVIFRWPMDKTLGKVPVHRLRFTEAKFTAWNPQGKSKTIDVSSVLNGMAIAHAPKPGQKNKPPKKLEVGGHKCLGDNCEKMRLRPLNPFTFTIPGFNDRATVPTQDAAQRWNTKDARLEGTLRKLPYSPKNWKKSDEPTKTDKAMESPQESFTASCGACA
jgi:hypothetical protein